MVIQVTAIIISFLHSSLLVQSILITMACKHHRSVYSSIAPSTLLSYGWPRPIDTSGGQWYVLHYTKLCNNDTNMTCLSCFIALGAVNMAISEVYAHFSSNTHCTSCRLTFNIPYIAFLLISQKTFCTQHSHLPSVGRKHQHHNHHLSHSNSSSMSFPKKVIYLLSFPFFIEHVLPCL